MASPAFGSDESRKSASLPASTPTSRASLSPTAFNSNVSVSVSLINEFHDRAEPRQVARVEIESRAPNLRRHLVERESHLEPTWVCDHFSASSADEPKQRHARLVTPIVETPSQLLDDARRVGSNQVCFRLARLLFTLGRPRFVRRKTRKGQHRRIVVSGVWRERERHAVKRPAQRTLAQNLVARHLFRQAEFVQQAEQEQKPAEAREG